MNYWWVNHSQSHRFEVGGGYIWSPKRAAGNRELEAYNTLGRVRAGDVVFSYADVAIRAIGVATGPARDAPKPVLTGATGENWNNDGWLVPIEWQLLQVPVEPRQHLEQIGPLLPKVHSPIRQQTGLGNMIYLSSISGELGRLLETIISTADSSALESAAESSAAAAADQQETDLRNQHQIPETMVEQLVRARRGQGQFRQNLLRIEKACRLTGVSSSQFLIASHIKPWAASTNEERLDGHNGLLLAPHVDKLFDRGWVSIADDGTLLVANAEAEAVLKAWKLAAAGHAIGLFSARQREYLAYHRSHIFRRVFHLAEVEA